MKKNQLIMLCIACLMFAVTQKAVAVPAYPFPVQYTLPNGEFITIRLHGDENFNWVSTEDGYTLLLNEAGFYEYAKPDANGNLICSGVVAHEPDVRVNEQAFLQTLPKDLTFSDDQLSVGRQMRRIQNEARERRKVVSTGNLKLLVLLAQFQDTVFKPYVYNATSAQQAFTELLNQPGYNKEGFIGSAYDYFLDNSCGQLKIHADVYGPYTASKKLKYYGEDIGSHRCPYVQELIKEMLDSAYVNGVDFTNYDNDHNDTLDALYVIYAGTDQSQTSNKIEIWAHEAPFEDGPYMVGGIAVTQYSCSSEIYKDRDRHGISGLGVIVHEFSHAMGVMDYYDTDQRTNGVCTDPSVWDVMASGSHTNTGRNPPIHNGYSREKFGWQKIIELTNPGPYTLPKPIAGDSNSMQTYKISTFRGVGENAEFFLFENRQLTKWDAMLPGPGLLVWKVDEKVINSTFNCINCYSDLKKQGLMVVPADGHYDYYRYRKDVIFPFNGVDSITNTFDPLSPTLIGNDSTPAYYEIRNIVNNEDGIVTFNLQEDTTVHLVNICNVPEQSTLNELFNDVINGAEINTTDGWTTFDNTPSNLKWQGVNQDGKSYVELKPNTIAASSSFDSWLISPTIANDQEGKLVRLAFMQNASNWKSAYKPSVKILHCVGTKTYYEELSVEGNFPVVTPVWRMVTKTLPDIKGPFALAFTLTGVNTGEEMTMRIDSVVTQYVNKPIVRNAQEEEKFMFSMNPNPVSNTLYISSAEVIKEVLVYDIFGRLMTSRKVMDKETSLNVEALANGMYLVQCRYINGLISSEKMIKK